MKNEKIYALLLVSSVVFAEDTPQDLGIMNIVGTSPISGAICEHAEIANARTNRF
jgi:hypothetical protein